MNLRDFGKSEMKAPKDLAKLFLGNKQFVYDSLDRSDFRLTIHKK